MKIKQAVLNGLPYGERDTCDRKKLRIPPYLDTEETGRAIGLVANLIGEGVRSSIKDRNLSIDAAGSARQEFYRTLANILLINPKDNDLIIKTEGGK